MKTYSIIMLAVTLMFVGNAYSDTIATFSDPALNASTPLFKVDNVAKTIKGGWTDAQTGLNLQVVINGNTFNNTFFTMTDLTYTGSLSYAVTGAGTIKFFANNSDTAIATPLLQIDFASSSITFGGIGGDNIFSGNNVVFGGSELAGKIVSDEVFAFSFANLKAVDPTSPKNGYSATASFTSSATVVPEPATIAILALGSILFRKK
jgi:hypothetical protein